MWMEELIVVVVKVVVATVTVATHVLWSIIMMMGIKEPQPVAVTVILASTRLLVQMKIMIMRAGHPTNKQRHIPLQMKRMK